MGDDNEQNLLNYKLQLQQVEAALELDRDNDELKTLKAELEQIIGLTLQLLGRDPSEALDPSDAFGWKVGDHCSALWARDKQYYPAVLTDIKRDGTCFVAFAHLPQGSHAEQCQVSLLKPLADSSGTAAAGALTAQGSNAAAAKKRRRDERTKALEVKARKVAKRAEREKEMEAAVEREKRSWQCFSKKIAKQGKVGKSIFATPGPDNPKGRVGVGTCGIAGRGMTPFAAPLHRPQASGAGGVSGAVSASLAAAAAASAAATSAAFAYQE